MHWTEVINIKAYSSREASKIADTFNSLALVGREPGLLELTLLRNCCVAGDFYIRMTWLGELPDGGKSPLGCQLVAAFSTLGFVYHFAWLCEAGLAVDQEEEEYHG